MYHVQTFKTIKIIGRPTNVMLFPGQTCRQTIILQIPNH